jgi:Fic family protein|tara:strand:+ start:216 stop:419 length:204 start_codon:yes stop_codon:yes gene_type:complete
MQTNFDKLEKKNKISVKETLNSPGGIKKAKQGYNTYNLSSQSAQKSLKDRENHLEYTKRNSKNKKII